jgi:predicted dienelactone hydrolase
MRPYEIALLALIFIALASKLNSRSSAPKLARNISWLSALAFIPHLLFEGTRWQLYPAYVLLALLILAELPSSLATRSPQKIKKALTWLGLLILALSTALAILLPVAKNLPTTGPFAVGTVSFHWTDPSRNEIYGPAPNSPRELMIQIWYPADIQRGATHAKWLDGVELFSRVLADWLELPSFSLSHLNLVEATAFLDQPLIPSPADFPVLIFSHGWSGFREQNIYQTEELASQGYIVVAINHTYGAMASIFPGDRLVVQNPDALPDNVSDAEYKLAAERLAQQWAADIAFTFDQLAALNTDSASPFAARLDMSATGLFGHSTGAAAIIEFCATDVRCQAALLMDPWMTPVSDAALSAAPKALVLSMFSENWDTLSDPAYNYGRFDQWSANLPSDHLIFTISGTKHADFTAIPLLSPLTTYLGLKGPIQGTRGLEIINDYSVAFFNNAFTAKEPAIPLNEESFPELIYGSHP